DRRPRRRDPGLRPADAGAARRRRADHRRRVQREPRLAATGAEDPRPPRPPAPHHRRARRDARAGPRHGAAARRDRPPRRAPEHRAAVRGGGGRRPDPSRREPRGQLRGRVRVSRHRRGGDRSAGTDRAARGRRAAEVLARRGTATHRGPARRAPRAAPRGRGHDGDGSSAVIAIIVSGAVALLLSILGTPLFIKVLERRGYGQFVRDDGPTSHATKRGTPTMGGVAIILAVLVAYFLTHLVLWT